MYVGKYYVLLSEFFVSGIEGFDGMLRGKRLGFMVLDILSILSMVG